MPNDNDSFLEKWKEHSGLRKQGMEWTLFVPAGAKPRTQRQFNLYNYYRFIHALIKNRDFKRGVELGCGRGTLSLFLNKYDGLEMTLVDIAEDAIALAKENFEFFGGAGKFLTADASKTGLPDNYFDLTLSIGLLEHLDYQPVLAEEYRILRPGGLLVALNLPGKISVQTLNNFYKLLLKPFVPRAELKKDYYRNIDKPRDYLRTAEAVGFKSCRVINFNPFAIWTPIPRSLEPVITLLYRSILGLRSLVMIEPMKTNYLFS